MEDYHVAVFGKGILGGISETMAEIHCNSGIKNTEKFPLSILG